MLEGGFESFNRRMHRNVAVRDCMPAGLTGCCIFIIISNYEPYEENDHYHGKDDDEPNDLGSVSFTDR